MKTFRKPETQPLDKFVQDCGVELLLARGADSKEARATIAYEDWDELIQLLPVQPAEGAEGVELAMCVLEWRFVVAPLLGQARGTLVEVKGGAD